MTGHILGDAVLISVGAIVLTWVVSALFGWIYLAWLILPTTTLARRISAIIRR